MSNPKFTITLDFYRDGSVDTRSQHGHQLTKKEAEELERIKKKLDRAAKEAAVKQLEITT
jgi:hypothetical protein